MLNLKLLGFGVLLVGIALIVADSNDGGAGKAANAITSNDEGYQYCPPKGSASERKTCPDPGFAWHYNCCSDDKECCFAFEVWVYAVFGVIAVVLIGSILIAICCCCCKKN